MLKYADEEALIVIDAFKEIVRVDPFKKPTLRKHPYPENRAVLCYLLRTFTKMGYDDIGKLWKTKSYKGKNHATILHQVNRIKNLIDIGDEKVINKYTPCYIRIKDILSSKDDGYYELSYREKLHASRVANVKLINREINRKSALVSFKSGLEYIPLKYKKYIKEYLEVCQIPL